MSACCRRRSSRKLPKKPKAEITAHERAVRLLARREHSALELRQKLRQRGHEISEVEAELDALQARGWQSDERFAESRVNSRIGAGHGPLKIRAELQAAGVAESHAKGALVEAEVDWDAQIREVHRRRFGQPPDGPKAWQQQFRFLAGRGFTSEQIHRLLRDCPEPDD